MEDRAISGVNCITSFTPTICGLLGILPPVISDGNVIEIVIRTAQGEFEGKLLSKCLVYTPDAIGTILYRKYESYFEPILRHAPLTVPLQSVIPPKTPVCFASMFTGALPEVHGIRVYEKPVLTCDTIFDALGRAGKCAAIVAVEDSSIDRIFRERPIDYFSEKYDEQVTQRVITLLEANKHDFILAYHQEFDDALHVTTPESPQALRAMRNHIKSFDVLAIACQEHWRDTNRLIVFAPDHGAHIDPATGKGTHSENIAEDMEVTHFFGFGGATNL